VRIRQLRGDGYFRLEVRTINGPRCGGVMLRWRRLLGWRA
jgi:hypothetical protein